MFKNLFKVNVPQPDLLTSARRKSQERSNEELAFRIRHRDVRSVVDSYPDSEVIRLDDQTLEDLQIFRGTKGDINLFDYCNYTRNAKGAGVLHARMLKPLSSPARIHAVQQSVSFLVENHELFERLPSHITTNYVENYVNGILPLAMSRNLVEFMYEVFEIRLGDTFHYDRIMFGMEQTSAFIRGLRDFISLPALSQARGELALILQEMKLLLQNRSFKVINERRTWAMFPWTILRIDQGFRLHEKDALGRLLQLTYELDALLSMAHATRKNALVMPGMDEGALHVQARGVFHPLIENAVDNPFNLSQQQRFLFLTGPNMAGKTTYLRACGVALFLAHLGMGVPAQQFRFSPAQRLYTAINLADNLSIGVSYFRAEALRIKTIAKALSEGHRVIAILDEPFKGTNVKDALDASNAIMARFAGWHDCLFMFSSHLIEMKDKAAELAQVDSRNFEAEESGGQLSFDYVLKDGVSAQRLGMRVLREEGIFELLDSAGSVGGTTVPIEALKKHRG